MDTLLLHNHFLLFSPRICKDLRIISTKWQAFSGGLIDPVGPGGGVHVGLGAGEVGGGMVLAVIIGELELRDGGLLVNIGTEQCFLYCIMWYQFYSA